MNCRWLRGSLLNAHALGLVRVSLYEVFGRQCQCARRADRVRSSDYSREKPVADDNLKICRSFYEYDNTTLNSVVESVEEIAHAKPR